MDKKNLRKMTVTVTAQTRYHLNEMCARAGYGEKDVGRVIDKLVRAYCAQIRLDNLKRKRGNLAK